MPPLRRKQSILDLAALARGEAGADRTGARLEGPRDPASGECLPSLVLTTSEGSNVAVTPERDGSLSVWALQQTRGAWRWALQENRSRFTTGVKTFASAVIMAGFAMQAREDGNRESEAKWLQAAGNTLMAATAASDAAHYLQSAIKNWRKNPRSSAYDLSKAAVQGAALAVGTASSIVPILRDGAQTAWGLANTVVQTAGYYATGSTTSESLEENKRADLGRTLPNHHIASGRASSQSAQYELQSLVTADSRQRPDPAAEPHPGDGVSPALHNQVSDYLLGTSAAAPTVGGWADVCTVKPGAPQVLGSGRPFTEPGPSNQNRSPAGRGR